MTAAWTVLTAEDVKKFMSSAVVLATNEDIFTNGVGRVSMMTDTVVKRIRAAIGTANRVPLSATTGSIPPEAEQHALVMIAAQLSASVPQLNDFVASAAFKLMHEKAEDWMSEVHKGLNITRPSDPDSDTESEAPAYGSMSAAADLSTE